MADFTPYAITLGATDYPSKYAGLLGYLDTLISPLPGRNKIINGKMEIAQRGTSFAAIASGTYTLDRFQWQQAGTGVVTVSQQADVPSSNEFQNSLRVAVTTADTSIAAGDIYAVRHVVEGYNVRDLIGKTLTLSFWVRSSKTGTHCVSLVNSVGNRSFVAEYTVNAANTWESKSITINGGLITAGTWDWTNGIGISLWFVLAAGTTWQTTAGAWQTGSFYATSNQVNCLDSTSNIFAITGVQLEVGSVATPFEHRPIGAELALCQRYFCKTYDLGTAPGVATVAGSIYSISNATAVGTTPGYFPFPVEMRSAPTLTFYNPITGAAGTWRNGAGADIAVSIAGGVTASTRGVGISNNAATTAGTAFYGHAVAAIEL